MRLILIGLVCWITTSEARSIISSLSAGCKTAADRTAVGVCVRPWLDRWEILRAQESLAADLHFPLLYYSRDTVLSLCELYLNVRSTCLTDDVMNECSEDPMIVFLNSHMGYFCGRDAVFAMSKWDCLSTSIEKMPSCRAHIKGIPLPGLQNKQKCDGIPTFFKCLEKEIEGNCGEPGLDIIEKAFTVFGCSTAERDVFNGASSQSQGTTPTGPGLVLVDPDQLALLDAHSKSDQKEDSDVKPGFQFVDTKRPFQFTTRAGPGLMVFGGLGDDVEEDVSLSEESDSKSVEDEIDEMDVTDVTKKTTDVTKKTTDITKETTEETTDVTKKTTDVTKKTTDVTKKTTDITKETTKETTDITKETTIATAETTKLEENEQDSTTTTQTKSTTKKQKQRLDLATALDQNLPEFARRALLNSANGASGDTGVDLIVPETCTDNLYGQVIRCLGPLSQRWDEIHERLPDLSSVYFPLYNYTTSDLLTLCETLQTSLNQCLNVDLIGRCGHLPIIQFVNSNLGFACGSRQSEFFLTFDCTQRVMQENQQCLSTVQGVNQPGVTATERCKNMPEYFECMEPHIMAKCSRESLKMFTQSIQHFGCAITPSESSQTFKKAELDLQVPSPQNLPVEKITKQVKKASLPPQRITRKEAQVLPPLPNSQSEDIITQTPITLVATGVCTKEHQQKAHACLLPLMTRWTQERESLQPLKFAVFMYSPQTLLEFCDAYANSFLCGGFEPFAACVDDDFVRFANSHLGYLCSPPNIGAFMNSFECTRSVLLQADECLRFILGSIAPGEDQDRCNGMSQFYSCLEPQVQGVCGPESVHQLSETITQFGCDF